MNLNGLLKQALSHSDPDKLVEAQKRGLSAEDREFLENALKAQGEGLADVFNRLRSAIDVEEYDQDAVQLRFDELLDSACETHNAVDLIRIDAFPYFFDTLLVHSNSFIISNALQVLSTAASNNPEVQNYLQEQFNAIQVSLNLTKHQDATVRLRSISFCSSLLQNNSNNISIFGKNGIDTISAFIEENSRFAVRILHILNYTFDFIQEVSHVAVSSIFKYLALFPDTTGDPYLEQVCEEGVDYLTKTKYVMNSSQTQLVSNWLNK
ncbi:hypothetical protein P9112_011001 [Eukaryota sp. TZLM1-RC]